MYRPRVEKLIQDLETGGGEDDVTKYDHHQLSRYIIDWYGVAAGGPQIPAWKDIPSDMMTAGTWLGMSIPLIRSLFLPHTIKKSWDDITSGEVARVLRDALSREGGGDRIRWELVTEIHAKMRGPAVLDPIRSSFAS